MRRLHLSQREGQVMRGIWDGRKHAAIAANLGISRHTVDTHWRRIKQKLNANGPIEAVHRIYEVVFELRLAQISDGAAQQPTGLTSERVHRRGE